MTNTHDKAVHADTKAAYWLHLGNRAKERGEHEKAERHYEKAQKWHDKATEYRGDA